MSSSLTVELPGNEYDIHIGRGLLKNAALYLSPFLTNSRVYVVTDDNVSGAHLGGLRVALAEGGIATHELVLAAGEDTKNWEGLQKTVEWLIEAKAGRDDVVVALGGGVIGDLVGFASAITRRGLSFVQIPTTLLAQVDSAVGGKTAINSPNGKNLIGAFHQPKLVLSDTELLQTLPRRDFLAGYGEVIKYGMLGDYDFFEWLEKNGPALAAGDHSLQEYAVRRSCEMKADIVLRDEKEHGDRALLNLGHTFGHALEAATGYSDRLLHGEGVSIGCALAFEVSARLGYCSQEAPSRVRAHLKSMGMKTDLTDIEGDLPGVERLIALMGQDKKVRNDQLTFIMVRSIGDAFVCNDIDLDAVRAVLDEALSARKTS